MSLKEEKNKQSILLERFYTEISKQFFFNDNIVRVLSQGILFLN